MKLFKLRNFALITAAGLSLLSCDNYIDINESPNNATESNMTPDSFFPGAVRSLYANQATEMNEFGNIMMQNWGGDVNNWTGVNVKHYTLAIDNTFYASIWNNTYLQLANLQKVLNYDSESYDNHKAAALIIKTFYMQYIVDLYGSAPYSEAFQGTANITPAYDNDKAIYRALVDNLDLAMELIDNADNENEFVSDIVFSGEMAKWKAFANTIKLRLLLRQSGLTDAETTAYLTEKFAEVQTLGEFMTEDVLVDPGFTGSTVQAQMNPLYGYFFTQAGAEQDDYRSTRATDYVASFMNGTLPGVGVVDPRRGRIYNISVSGGQVVGAVQGENSGPTDMSEIGTGVFKSADAPGLILGLAETKFMLAEAIHKGYLAGNLQAEFDAGIQASCNYLGVSAAATSAYISSVSSNSTLSVTGSNPLQAIMIQKWIATNGLNGVESFVDYVRTGYPDVPLATTAQETHRFFRLMYPNTEITGNGNNVPNLPFSQIFVQGAFWKN